MIGRWRSRPEETRPLPWKHLLSLLLLVSILMVGACGDDSPPWTVSPAGADRWIEGHVRGAGGPLEGAWVQAVRIGTEPGLVETKAVSDTLGHFILPVSAGEYIVRVGGCDWYSRAGVVPCTVNPSGKIDTLRFVSGVDRLQADPLYGGARIVVHCRPGLENRSITIGVAPRGQAYRFEYGGGARVQGDSAVVLIDKIPNVPGPLEVAVYAAGVSVFPFVPEPAGAPDTFRCRPGEWVHLRGRIPGLAEATLRVRGSYAELRAEGYDIASPRLLAYGTDSTVAIAGPRGVDDTGLIMLPLMAADDLRFALKIGPVWRWIGGQSHRTATPYTFREGESRELPEVLESGILCRLDPGWEKPAFPGTFELHASTGRQLATISLDSGNYLAWPNLDPGAYLLRYDPGGQRFESPWLARWYPAATTQEAAVPVVVTGAGTLTRIEWPMTPSGSIFGTVATMPDAPTGRTGKLELFQAGDSLSALYSRTCVYGSRVAFQLRDLEDGDYTLAIRFNSSSGQRFWWYPGSWTARQAERLALRGHGQIEILRWEWPR